MYGMWTHLLLATLNQFMFVSVKNAVIVSCLLALVKEKQLIQCVNSSNVLFTVALSC